MLFCPFQNNIVMHIYEKLWWYLGWYIPSKSAEAMSSDFLDKQISEFSKIKKSAEFFKCVITKRIDNYRMYNIRK